MALVLVDFIYYWWHRLSHRYNVLWAAHVVHHQSQDYNLAVALRQSMTTSTTALPFYLPMAVIGIPPVVYAAARGINTLYQFWIHTELVSRIGPLEAVLNTPSHHRVHHGINPQYLDRNHAGMFIVWDKAFGTFEPEDEAVVYGTVAPLETFDAIEANIQPWVELWRLVKAGGPIALLKYPAWRPDGPDKDAPPVSRATFVKYERRASPALRGWIITSFVITGAGVFALLLYRTTLTTAEVWLAGAFLLLSVWAWGALIQGRKWAAPLEILRWLVGTAALLTLLA